MNWLYYIAGFIFGWIGKYCVWDCSETAKRWREKRRKRI